MASAAQEMNVLRRLCPEVHGLTVFDAETQETSYGTLVVDGLPLIYDTHRKEKWYVSTVEVLTETVRPVRATPREVATFGRLAQRRGVQVIPYSACFFKGNLHVYAYDGSARGFDLAVVGGSVPDAEAKMDARTHELWPRIPKAIVQAQRDLLAGRRQARYPADLDVLMKRLAAISVSGAEVSRSPR